MPRAIDGVGPPIDQLGGGPAQVSERECGTLHIGADRRPPEGGGPLHRHRRDHRVDVVVVLEW